ncbi:Hypothetical predicted protein [Cloeon dipterum]|uniref:Protein quiver n=1 Tax=Cloeon dipterum TaxID=197152 RepID=A0A8S1E2E9_9INSE|nr:Hypothetical predicted protein [Cloeon dipterum]
MHAAETFGLCFLILFVQSGFALECHTCNSHDDKGCEKEVFKPVSSTQDVKNCDESLKKTIEKAQSILFPDYFAFPYEALNPTSAKFNDICFKITIAGKDRKNRVTFRGCSVLGSNTCLILDPLIQNTNSTVEGCHECSQKNLCNDARATLPVFSAYLIATLAIMLYAKF